MTSYDDRLDAGCEPRGEGCRYCQGDDAAEDPCSEECAEGMWRGRRRQRILALKATIFRATELAKTYRAEEGVVGTRERAALRQIAACEAEIRCWEQCEFGDPNPLDSIRNANAYRVDEEELAHAAE